MPLDLHKKVGETHAVIPHDHPLPALLPQDGIQEDDGSVDMHVDQPFHHSNLWGSNGPSGVSTSLEIHQCITEVRDELPQSGELLSLNHLADFKELRVAEQRTFNTAIGPPGSVDYVWVL